jgi:hypothetical protein
MRFVRPITALVQAAAVAATSIVFCPCRPLAASAVEEQHSCCGERKTAVLEANDDCCGFCQRTADRAELSQPQPVPGAGALQPATLTSRDLPLAGIGARFASHTPSPPTSTAPSQLRI